MQRFPSARRHLIGVTTAIPSSKIPELKRRLEGAMQDLHLFCEEGEDNKDEVIQLNMNFFPLSTPRKKMT